MNANTIQRSREDLELLSKDDLVDYALELQHARLPGAPHNPWKRKREEEDLNMAEDNADAIQTKRLTVLISIFASFTFSAVLHLSFFINFYFLCKLNLDNNFMPFATSRVLLACLIVESSISLDSS
jgi:hypothetical protein